MGICVSTPATNIKSNKRNLHRPKKFHGKVTSAKHANIDSRRVADFAMSKLLHMSLGKGSKNARKRTEVTNSTIHVTQVQWHEFDTNGIYLYTYLGFVNIFVCGKFYCLGYENLQLFSKRKPGSTL